MRPGPYTLRYETLVDGWTRASVAEYPAATAEASTPEEAREMTLVALLGLLRAGHESDPSANPPALAA